jgi:hypothetical protein
MNNIRQFETGATRDTDEGKFDYEGFISPLVLESFAAYMHECRKMSDGSLRSSDNWQKGIPVDQYMKSKWRHFMSSWKKHRGYEEGDIIQDLNGELFNTMGMMHEILKERQKEEPLKLATDHPIYEDNHETV